MRLLPPANLLACLLVLLFSACVHTTSGTPPTKPLNVVFLVADDLRLDAVLGPNSSVVPTPNIDRLASRGMAFSRAYCAGSFSGAVCAPSRGMLISGRSLSSFIDTPFNPKVDCTLMPEAFRAAGYETFATGKWHSGPSWFQRSFSDGGNIFFGGMGPHVGLLTRPFDPSGAYPREAAAPNPVFSSEAFANSTLEFLGRRQKDKPFFAWISFTAAHDPRTPPDDYVVDPQTVSLPANFLEQHPFDNGELIVRDEQLAATPRVPAEVKQHIADYSGMITHMDAQIGRILDELDRSGETENTVIVFVSNHGLAMGSHGLLGKQNLYEHSMGSPIIIAAPGIQAGSDSNALAYLYDLFPTVADLANLPIPDSVQGQSFAPVLRGNTLEHRQQILTAYRDVQRAVTETRWKYIEYPRVHETQLFDLLIDPNEKTNLSGLPQHAAEEARLKKDLLNLQVEENIPLASRRPNILLLYSDDHASAAVSAYGSDLPATPNIDRLANQGLRFDNAFCTNAICGPARAVVLTGKHSHINGFIDNNNSVFNGDQQTFPKLLQKAGYETAIIGKWHLNSTPQGFDYWDILPGQGRYYSPEFINNGGKYSVPGYNTDVIADKAIDWLNERAQQNKPFMLMCQFKAPHRAWQASPQEVGLFDGIKIPEPATLFDSASTLAGAAREQKMSIAKDMWLYYDLKVPPLEGEELTGPDRWAAGREKHMTAEELAAWNTAYEPRNAAFRAANLEGEALVKWKYQRYVKDYLRCIQGIDRNVGRILDALDESGLSDNTVVIYTSDQGFFLGEHGWYDKRFMYEPSLKVPLLVRWPGVIQEGASRADLVQNLDFAPTFLELAGARVPEDMQGESLVPILRGHGMPQWRKGIYYEYSGEATHNVAAHYGIRTSEWKLIHYPRTDEWELLDLVNDPNEIVNQYGNRTYSPIIGALKSQLLELRKQYEVIPPRAELTMPSIFSDGMVMQRNSNVPVWGTAEPSSMISVTTDWGASSATIVKADGSWSIDVAIGDAGGPHRLQVTESQHSLSFSGVLFGEVWICGGQSNMEWTLGPGKGQGIDNWQAEVENANFPEIRLFDVPHQIAATPQANVEAQWQSATSETATTFSAIGFLYGRRLHLELNVPIGLISCNWGGTLAEAWMSKGALNSFGGFENQLGKLASAANSGSVGKLNQNTVTALSNGMLSPILPYGIRGTIWYQGESNAGRPTQYRTLFPALIQDWRARWDCGDFPFYFVQIAPFKYGKDREAGALRDAQRRALTLPNTGMAVTMDIGNIGNIHPTNKQDVADRLARWALANTYQREVGTICGPLFQNAELVDGNTLRIQFEFANGLTTSDGEAPSYLEVLDENGIWHSAEGRIENDMLFVSSSSASKPRAVRYAWASAAVPNLINAGGLPASTFTSE